MVNRRSDTATFIWIWRRVEGVLFLVSEQNRDGVRVDPAARSQHLRQHRGKDRSRLCMRVNSSVQYSAGHV